MPRALKTCSTSGCPELVQAGRCPACTRAAEQARGTATARGYTSARHRQRFRQRVLARDPVCVLCHAARATVADHHPRSRRDLEALGLDPDDPEFGRGLCKRCHDRATAQRQPGGWNASNLNRS